MASTGGVRVLQLTSVMSQCEPWMTPTASGARTRGNKYVCDSHNAREFEGCNPANVREVGWRLVPRQPMREAAARNVRPCSGVGATSPLWGYYGLRFEDVWRRRAISREKTIDHEMDDAPSRAITEYIKMGCARSAPPQAWISGEESTRDTSGCSLAARRVGLGPSNACQCGQRETDMFDIRTGQLNRHHSLPGPVELAWPIELWSLQLNRVQARGLDWNVFVAWPRLLSI